MKCPKCGAKNTPVRDSRVRITTGNIHRRRQCFKCEHRFSTVEIHHNQFNAFLRLEETARQAEAELRGLKVFRTLRAALRQFETKNTLESNLERPSQ